MNSSRIWFSIEESNTTIHSEGNGTAGGWNENIRRRTGSKIRWHKSTIEEMAIKMEASNRSQHEKSERTGKIK